MTKHSTEVLYADGEGLLDALDCLEGGKIIIGDSIVDERYLSKSESIRRIKLWMEEAKVVYAQ